MSHILVVGGGAAGMMSAIVAARNGHTVTLLEKNEKCGKKIYITGKGRCNVTNASDLDIIFDNMMSNKKFLYSSFYTFTNEKLMDFFKEIGLPLKVERGNRVFPVSDKSSDVINSLVREMNRLGVNIMYHANVDEVMMKDGQVTGVKVNKKVIKGDSVIVCTGGLSYAVTGSTGDGYRFAKNAGHTIKECKPSLVPLMTKEAFVKDLQGLSLRNVELTLKAGKKVLYQNFGEMLFTHFGITGPLVLSASSYAAAYTKGGELEVSIDLKPALNFEQLDQRLLRDFEKNINRKFANSLDELLPKKLIPIIIDRSGINPEKKVNEVTKEERTNLVQLMKSFTLTIASLGGYNTAVITKGGVTVKEIDPSTMESKLVRNLYFAGEVLDLDALTGGFNLQIAWSTGYLAGMSVQ
ncbi:MAG: NAD(P)/FAD-dependent oxidoreductase [bacterium]|nr:NAD(P)/FAD-dependent oxidoreductase [bacterium]